MNNDIRPGDPASLASWSGKSAIVTGAAAGIGAAVAEELAALGVAVTAATLRAGEGGEEVVDHITAKGGRARLAFGDMTEEAAVTALVDAATREYGRPDILVHAAGGFTSFAGTAELAAADWDRIVAINLRSAFLVMHAVLPGMIDRRWGRIVTKHKRSPAAWACRCRPTPVSRLCPVRDGATTGVCVLWHDSRSSAISSSSA